MITNEERREVAARLRDYDNLRESLRESPICAFLDVLGVEGYMDWKGVCNLLAGLIEPESERTCTWTWNVEEGYWDCSNCGEISPEDYRTVPNYCPDCGFKINN